MLRRRRSANAVERAQQQQQQQQQQTSAPAATPNGPTHRIRLVPHLDSTRSLHFEAISRDVRQGDSPLRIGRFTEQPGNNSNKLAFKSKVVSRGHAEVWFDSGTVSGSHNERFVVIHVALVLHQRHKVFLWHIPQPHPAILP